MPNRPSKASQTGHELPSILLAAQNMRSGIGKLSKTVGGGGLFLGTSCNSRGFLPICTYGCLLYDHNTISHFPCTSFPSTA